MSALPLSAQRRYGLDIPEGYITGLGRDYPHPKLAHLYQGNMADPGLPMCRHGWNRDDGQSYSIWRNNIGSDGVCAVCLRRAIAGKDGVDAVELEAVK